MINDKGSDTGSSQVGESSEALPHFPPDMRRGQVYLLINQPTKIGLGRSSNIRTCIIQLQCSGQQKSENKKGTFLLQPGQLPRTWTILPQMRSPFLRKLRYLILSTCS